MTAWNLTSAPALALAFTLAASGSGYAQARDTQAPTTIAPNGAIDLSTQTEALTFISRMTVAGMAEVQLGKMAIEHSTNPEVKAFGQMMVTDHTQAGNELRQIASRMNITPPLQLDQKHRDLVDRLSKLHGAAFDREYMSAMVSGHQDVQSQMQARAAAHMTSNTPATDHSAPATTTPSGTISVGGTVTVGTSGSAQGAEAVTQWAAKALPTVQKHLDQARTLQQKVK